MNRNRRILQTALTASTLALVLVLPITSHAFLITSETLDDKFQINFLLEAGEMDGNDNENQTGQDLSATVIFTHTVFDADNKIISLELDVTNTSEDNGKKVGLWKLAFGMDPTAESVIFTHLDGANKFEADATKLMIDPAIENAVLDISTGAQTGTDPGYGCPGRGNKGCTLNEQEWQRFELEFTFSSLDSGVYFSPFGSFWQTNPDSFQFGSNDNGDEPRDPPGVIQVPEPATIGLLGIGLLGLGVASFRRRRILPTTNSAFGSG